MSKRKEKKMFDVEIENLIASDDASNTQPSRLYLDGNDRHDLLALASVDWKINRSAPAMLVEMS
tara:strand:+ start:223 stop:414 length:192 start_codon:yes stop_codon:yes gene_type:complete